MMDYGIRNLSLHCEEINDLNVFPVPDGDTGTNMVTTTRLGYRAMEDGDSDLRSVAGKFGSSVVYGARGNSGVIVSQFLKGFSEVFSALGHGAEADLPCFVRALENGVALAYRAVSHPTEGTILTVVREATEAVAAGTYGDLSELLEVFLQRARISLENTPNLLPVLKNAGVVDSGGVGIVYFFEGMYKYLNNETLSAPEAKHGEEPEAVDYGRFDRNSTFTLGYCTEVLLQRTNGKEEISFDAFRDGLNALGESVVATEEGDKLKLHVHTDTPEAVLSYAHRFGEFLSLKIENMSVQHSERTKRLLVSERRRAGAFALVAVAPNETVGKRFLEMGADVVLSLSEDAPPSTQEFLEAISAADCSEVLVFPNHKNLILTAEQARTLCGDASVTVADSKSIAHCYAALAMLDFEAETSEAAAETVRETLENVSTVQIAYASKDAAYGEIKIRTGDAVAMTGNSVIAAGGSVSELARRVIDLVMAEEERDTVTLFTGCGVAGADVESIASYIGESYLYTETDLVETDVRSFELLLSFE